MGEIKQPDNRWRHHHHKTDSQKAEAIAAKLLGRRNTPDSDAERWTVEENWRGMYGIAIKFETGYGQEVFVYEQPTQIIQHPPDGDNRVLHRVNFEPPHDAEGKITGISARDLRSGDDLPEDDPLLRPAQ